MSDNGGNLKSELDNLIGNMNSVLSDGGNDHFDKGNRNLDRIKTRMKDIPDFEDIDKQLKNKSLNVVNALFDFYNKYNGVNKKDKFYMHRMSLDALNFSNIFYQIKTIKLAINLIMEDMYISGVDAKLATALASLQDKLSEAIKAQANFVLFIEDQYKIMVLEGESEKEKLLIQTEPGAIAQITEGTQTQTQTHISKNSAYFLATNTKDVIKQIRKNEGVVPIKSDEPSPLTDPNNKIELMKELDFELDEDEKYATDYDGLMEII